MGEPLSVMDTHHLPSEPQTTRWFYALHEIEFVDGRVSGVVSTIIISSSSKEYKGY